MNKTKVIFGIGIVLAVLAVFTASAAAQNIVYFDPDPSSAGLGETITVTLWLNTSDGVASMNDDVYFNPAVVNITSVTAGDFPTMFGWVHHGDWVRIGGTSVDWLDKVGHLKLADFTLEAIGPGTSTLHHVGNGVFNEMASPVSATWYDGTYTCLSPPETYSKYLEVLHPAVGDWHLISLPLTNATDMTVANIMSSVSGNYDVLYKYDASTHNFVALSSGDTMENGVGYFIHMTTAGTWTYTGSAYIDMSVGLSTGLNMVGWLNCSKAITGNLTSIDGNYYYAAGWNATSQSYETYNPAAPDPDNPTGFNNLFDMERGTGYFISAKTATTLNEGC